MRVRNSPSILISYAYIRPAFRKRLAVFAASCVLFLFCAQEPASAVNFRELASVSSPQDDQFLISIILGPDYGEALSVCSGIALRQAKNVQNIIFALLDTTYGKEAYRSEHLLRVLLDGLLASASDVSARETLIRANTEAFDSLMRRMGSFRDCLLKANLIALFGATETVAYASVIAEQGSALVGTMRRQKGYLHPEERAEAFAFLDYCSTAGSKVFTELCSSIAEESRDKELVARAKQILRKVFSNREE